MKKETIKILDFSAQYKTLINFANNKQISRHKWFSFVEGFSSAFVHQVIGEVLTDKEIKVLDPFGGVGTTALTCQSLNISCDSFEVNPFIYDIAKTKLELNYDSKVLKEIIIKIEYFFKRSCKKVRRLPKLESKTFFEENNKDRGKWILDQNVSSGVFDILHFIDNRIEEYETKYQDLLRICLSRFLIEFSNVYRNGKALSYRSDWQSNNYTRKEIHLRFLTNLREVFLIDITAESKLVYNVNNINGLQLGDARILSKQLVSNNYDLVITSPPYLNSRDYTDVYRLELWILGYIEKFIDEQRLRKSTVVSHVQISLPNIKGPDVPHLNIFLKKLQDGIDEGNVKLWNKGIISMINGYFTDMQIILQELYRALKIDGKAYVNVSNSAYGGIHCMVDVILAEIAREIGFRVVEIRLARFINSSKQQNLEEKLRESVIVLSK